MIVMAKKILIISSSLRTDGNSAILAGEFARGAREAGHDVDTIGLADKAIGFCRGCLACQRTRRCVIHDDADAIAQRMKDADVLVFATPIYFYAVCGQLKTLLDRTNPLFPSDYAFRDVYLLATAADGDERAVDGAVKEIQGWIYCFEKTSLKGVVRGVGADRAGAVRALSAVLGAARDMGRNA